MTFTMQATTLPQGVVVPEHVADVAQALAQRLPEHLEDLVTLAADGHDPTAVRDSADARTDLLERAGLEDVRRLNVADAHPYVTGSIASPDRQAPTVLLYAHHDVQPVATPDKWASAPFEPTVRDWRLYGQGVQ